MMPQPLSLAEKLESIATFVHGLAFDAADERRPLRMTERLHDDIERMADELRATVRGHGK